MEQRESAQAGMTDKSSKKESPQRTLAIVAPSSSTRCLGSFDFVPFRAGAMCCRSRLWFANHSKMFSVRNGLKLRRFGVEKLRKKRVSGAELPAFCTFLGAFSGRHYLVCN
jgi:hypothetical protein